nr:hemerythrin domain-containing protein [Actinomadura sp. KC06]
MEQTDTEDQRFTTLVRRLIDDVSAHVQEEEGTLFPGLAGNTGPDEPRTLGDKVQSAKRTAPTRPHPSAPDTPPLNKLTGAGRRPGGSCPRPPARTRT